MTANEVKKEVLKGKMDAHFSHYVHGNMYYTIQLESGLYQFPIPVVETEIEYQLPENEGEDEIRIEVLVLSKDLGTTSFDAAIKGSFLNRWIGKAVESEDFIKIA